MIKFSREFFLSKDSFSSFLTRIFSLYSSTFFVSESPFVLLDHRDYLGKCNTILAHFHGDELMMMRTFSKRNMLVMVSKSKDGDLMTKVLTKMGYCVLRGSSSHSGGVALRQMIRLIKRYGYNASLAVDGPRGPIHQVKGGIIQLAYLTQVPIIPVVAHGRRSYRLKSTWNQLAIPMPFSRVDVYYGDPFFVPKNSTKAQREVMRHQLQERMLKLKKQVVDSA